jgi:hypothetical protein
MEYEVSYQDSVCYDLRSSFERQPGDFSCCPMCASTITRTGLPTSAAGQDFRRSASIPLIDFTYLFICPECKWWAVRESGADREVRGEWDYLAVGTVKKWELSSKDIPISVLRRYFEQHDRIDFKLLDASAFEKLIAECLRYEFQPCEVHHVGARGGKGDQGIDIYLIKDEIEWLIQVKRRLTDNPEPVDTIRLLNGVLLREGKYNGMVVTSAASFTRNAQSETSIKTPGAYCVKLINRGDVLSMIAKIPHEQNEPWRKVLNDEHWWSRSPQKISEEFKELFLQDYLPPSDARGEVIQDCRADNEHC